MEPYKETKSYMLSIIDDGTRSFRSITRDERTKLISLYVAELEHHDSLFEDQQPSRFIVGNFLEKPKSKECRNRFVNEIVDSIFSAHEDRLEDMFDEMYEKFICGMVYELSDSADARLLDGSERAQDMNQALRGY